MDPKPPPDPADVMRERIAWSMRGLDLTTRKGRALRDAALVAMQGLEELTQRQRTFRLWLAMGWFAFAAMVVLGVLSCAAIAWIVLRSDWSGKAQVVTLVAALSAFARGYWTILKRAARRLRSSPGGADDEPDADAG